MAARKSKNLVHTVLSRSELSCLSWDMANHYIRLPLLLRMPRLSKSKLVDYLLNIFFILCSEVVEEMCPSFEEISHMST